MSEEEPKSALEYVSSVTEINDISEHMMDEALDAALGTIVKLTVRQDINPVQVGAFIVKMQAWSGLFKLKARAYTTIDKGPANSNKKNIYFTVSEELDKLVQALKYLHRS